MKVGNSPRRHLLYRTVRSDKVQILGRRNLLARDYRRLVGELRSTGRDTAIYARDPSPTALAAVSMGRRSLDAVLGKYLRTLAEFRGAVETVFPARKSPLGNRRPLKRSRR